MGRFFVLVALLPVAIALTMITIGSPVLLVRLQVLPSVSSGLSHLLLFGFSVLVAGTASSFVTQALSLHGLPAAHSKQK